MLRNFKNDKTFLSAKFQFSVVQFVKVISNKPFFPLKALNPVTQALNCLSESQPSGFRPAKTRAASFLNGFKNIPGKACVKRVHNNDAL